MYFPGIHLERRRKTLIRIASNIAKFQTQDLTKMEYYYVQFDARHNIVSTLLAKKLVKVASLRFM
jgi:hypothetical protein